MSVPLTEQKILQLRSGNRCAFPGCNAPLVKKTAFGTRLTITGEIAHIVSEKPEGPRGGHALPLGEHDKYANLIFLCSSHHTEIDAHPEVYTVERLRQMKQNHEEAIEKTVTQTKHKEQSEVPALPLVTEMVYSTLLPVIRCPDIFSVRLANTETHSRRKQARKCW